MIEGIISRLTAFSIAVIAAGGYWGVMALMAIESACIPLPSEIIMPFAGALSVPEIALRFHRPAFSLLWAATAGALGCNLGSVVAYWIGAYGGRPLVEKFGRYVLLSRHDLDRVTHYFERWGGITVFVGRLLPVVRTFIALPAGIAKMPQGRFHLYTFLGSWPWCYALAYVGMRLGDHWDNDPRFKEIFHRFHLVVVIALLAGFVWFVWSHWRGRVRAQQAV